MKSVFYSESVIITTMMVILIIASISASALLLTQTATASIDKQGGTTNYDTDMTITAATTTTTNTSTGIITISTAPDNATQQQVAVGGGNITNSINQFLPQTVEIQPGESVTFSASNGSTEVHNVIFDLTNGTTILDVGVPFTLPTEALGGEVPTDVSEEVLPALPNSVAEPIIQNTSDGTQSIIGLNKIAFYPAVVDQVGDVTYLDEEELRRQMEEVSMQQQGMFIPSNLSTSYTMDNTERVVSSGIILDVSGFAALEEAGGGRRSQEETVQGFPLSAYPILSSFTVTFEQPGTYEYFCAFHPGMFGQVVVGGGGETSQTPSASAAATTTTPSTRQPLT